MGLGRRTDMIIIGAQKAGTTGLFNILSQHSQLHPPRTKELHFFSFNRTHKFLNRLRYISEFPLSYQTRAQDLIFESTPDYLFREKSAKNIHAFNRKMKFIVLLREPASRAFSAWSMFHRLPPGNALRDERSFKYAVNYELEYLKSGRNPLADELTRIYGYIFQGFYYQNIQNFLKYFPLENFLFIEDKSIRNTLPETLEAIYEFTGIRHEKLELILSNVGANQINQEESQLVEELKSVYASHNQKLFDLIGKTYQW